MKAELEARCEALQRSMDTLNVRLQEQTINMNDARDSVDQQKATTTQMRYTTKPLKVCKGKAFPET